MSWELWMNHLFSVVRLIKKLTTLDGTENFKRDAEKKERKIVIAQE